MTAIADAPRRRADQYDDPGYHYFDYWQGRSLFGPSIFLLVRAKDATIEPPACVGG
jgi:hypothetical protein